MKQLSILVVALAACSPPPRGTNGGDDDGTGGVDAGTDPGVDGGGSVGVTSVYAHTSTKLYRVDPESLAISEIGNFGWSNGADEMTDIAIDNSGLMIGVSWDSVYRIDPTNAAATRLTANLSGDFNGLSFVPASMVGESGDDVLVGTRNTDGTVFRINPMTGASTAIGNMGSYASSGDLVAVANFTMLTADNGFSNDRLVRLAPNSFSASLIGGNIGYAEIWGVAYWKDKIFGFTSGGQFVTIDPTTGVGTVVQSNGPEWWGAAVTTSAPVLL